MKLVRSTLLLVVFTTCVAAGAQTAVTADGTGTVNNIPKYSGAATLTNSAITEANGYVGIWNTSPQARLDIHGWVGDTFINLYNAYGVPQVNSYANIMFSGPEAPNGFALIQGGGDGCCYGGGPGYLSFQTNSGGVLTERMHISPSFAIGMGTDSPQNNLSLINGINVDQNDSDNGNAFTSYQSNLGISFGDASGEGISSARTSGSPNQYGLDFYTGFGKRMSLTNGGYVGIGTTTPNSTLEVNGSITLTSGSTGGIIFPNGVAQTVPYIPSTATTPVTGVWNGAPLTDENLPANVAYTDLQQVFTGQNSFTTNIGVGTSNLINAGTGATSVTLAAPNFPTIYYQSLSAPADETTWRTLSRHDGNGHGRWQLESLNDAINVEVAAIEVLRNGSAISSVTFPNGSVGVGTSSPGTDLQNNPNITTPPVPSTPIFEVNGDIALSQNTGSQMYFSDGSVQSTAWNGTTLGGDYAEAIDVLGDRATYEPGDVIAIDGSSPGKFLKSAVPYSKLVAGVYSTKPGLVGRRTTVARIDKDAEVPMAMMGIAPTKVNTENGPIEPGDLLVTSSNPGYAMKATDPSRTMGAVIGKALAPLKSGSGVIEVLISLQ